MSFDDEFMRALRAASPRKPAKAKKRKASRAKTRYGYLVIDWPIVEDDIEQSGGGAILLGEEDEMTISRSSHPKAELALKENLERLQQDAHTIIGPTARIFSHRKNIFLSNDKVEKP